jgi:hypothetical protein
MPTYTFNFKPKQVTRKMLVGLSPRSQEVIINRYGLGPNAEQSTLEAVGQKYGITRERVRQIENHALEQIRKSDTFAEHAEVFSALEGVADDMGGIVPEGEILDALSKDQATKNHFYLLLDLSEPFMREKETADFHHRWHINPMLADAVHNAINTLAKNISSGDIISEQDIINMMLENTDAVPAKYRRNDIAERWLRLSKKIHRNPLGEWGLHGAPGIKVKGMRDFAYLALRRHGSPMHFTEVAKSVKEFFGKNAHEATCHNELIKDSRFVLVGRGLYALSEWGYVGGVVKDVIVALLQEQGPMTRQEILERVLKERYVKPNTIVVNLENNPIFQKNADGKYFIS